MGGTSATNLIVTLLILAGGTMLLVRGWRSAEDRALTHQQRIDDRLSRGTDAYLDELRTLQAYRPTANPWWLRIFGCAALLFGVTRLFFQFL